MTIPPAPADGTRPHLTCPLCGGQSFSQERSRSDSRWGFTSHRMTLMICNQCRFVLHFSEGRSFFDFD